MIYLGVFTLVPKEESNGLRTYGSRFVDNVKDEGLKTSFENSRLVVQEFNNKGHQILTYAPNVQRASQRLLLSFFAMDPELKFFSRDILQENVRADTNITRPLFLRPPEILGIPDDLLLRVERKLHGITEAGINWFLNYQKHHTEKLMTKISIHGSCFLVIPNIMGIKYSSEDISRGFTCLQTEDTLNADNKKVMQNEADDAIKFDCKPTKKLKNGREMKLNGATVSLKDGIYFMYQPTHASKLYSIDTKNINKEALVSQRERASYISAFCRPDLSYGFFVSSQATEQNEKDVALLKKCIELC